MKPSGSLLPLPSSVTMLPDVTTWPAPAFAIGNRFDVLLVELA
jgi:hypothetical protein